MAVDIHFSSLSSNQSTPQDFFDKLHKRFNFTLDVAANQENTKCERWLGPGSSINVDALSHDWTGERCFMNPPYGRSSTGKWVKKAFESNSLVVCLIPARTDTRWFHNFCWDQETGLWRPGVSGTFIKGRLNFDNNENSAPFPSLLVVFGMNS